MKIKVNKLSAFIFSITLLSSSVLIPGITNAGENKVFESKITTSLAEAMSIENDEIPVYIWYKDINNDKIENKVKERIGFSSDDIENEYAAPSEELINELSTAANGEPNEHLKILMENYLNMTAAVREEESRKTNSYIEVLNEELNSAYYTLSNKVKKENSISDEEIIFTSSFAPLIIASLSPDEINNLVKKDNICQLDLYREFEIEASSINMGNTLTAMGIDDIASTLSLTGSNVKIGIHDVGNVSITQDQSALDCNLDTNKVTLVGNAASAQQSDHATYVAAIAAGRDGIAPNALIYSTPASTETFGSPTLQNFEALISAGVRVINCSWNIAEFREDLPTLDCYTSIEKYFDDVISRTGVTTVFAAGNTDNKIIPSPSLAFNVITVNGFMNNVINNYSYNHSNGCYKPDVIACSLNNGTSTSAPVISGMIALMYEYKPNLMTHPEVIKAILLASVHEKIHSVDINGVTTSLNENLTSGLTDRQGAGVPNLYRMISIIAQHSYGYGKFTNDSGYSRDIPILQPKYNAEKINVSLAYLQTDVTVSNPDTCDDYDISLINPSLSTKVSNKSRSSTEMIYHNISNINNNYTLRIQRYENANSPMIHMAEIKYGYAWSTDNTIFYPTNYEDGIYYIKNAKSGKYLTYDNNDDDVKVENFAGDMTQLWVFNDDYGTMDYLKSANGIDNNLDLGTLSGTFYKAIKSSNNFRIGLFNNTDGTYSFERFIGTASYRLGVYNNSLNAGVEASWYTKDVNNSSQQWYLESTGYKRGDINMDGEITNTDASLALSFYSGSSTGNSNINNIQKFLADYDRNGIIDASDSSLILAALTS